MAAHGDASFDALLQRSIEDPATFWDQVVDAVGLRFTTPYGQVLEVGNGIPWATWFTGGRINVADQCADRHVDAGNGARPAVVWEGEDGDVRRWTYRELRAEADGLAALLAEQGVHPGDAVGIFCPMVPEAIAAFLGVAKVGAVVIPLFSGFAADAVVTRLADASAVALVTADGFHRRGQVVPMLGTAREAVAQVDSVRTTVVVPRLDAAASLRGGEVPWPGAGEFATEEVESEHPLLIAYTSGTTGRPKGAVHVHGGLTVKLAEEGAFQLDVHPDDTLFWFTDLGWIMGPWELVGTLANGGTLALFEGAPDFPGPDRLWAFLARHRVSIVGLSPTVVRSLMPHGAGPVLEQDLSAIRVLGSTGEPWNEAPWHWYFENVGGGRCPVINISGGTEVGACFLSPHPVQPIKPMSLGGPALGMAVDVFDETGRSVRGEVGELVCTRPWPGMTRGLYQDPERYLETYWSRWPDVWVHGDWASIDADGEWFLHGRSDDTINVAGKRVGPAEVESALVGHPAVVEAAVVGVPDEVKGETLWCYVVLAPGHGPDDELRADIGALVAQRLGKAFRPGAVRFTTALPKTRSAKVLRRAVKAAALGKDPGDLSSLDDPTSLDAVRDAT